MGEKNKTKNHKMWSVRLGTKTTHSFGCSVGFFYVEFIQLRIGAVSVEEAIQMLSLSFTF